MVEASLVRSPGSGGSNNSYISRKLFEGVQVSVSVSQHQSQVSIIRVMSDNVVMMIVGQASTGDSGVRSGEGTLAKYLLKLWIQKRLEQIRSNDTTTEATEESTEATEESTETTDETDEDTQTITCPDIYLRDENKDILCSLWNEYQVISF